MRRKMRAMDAQVAPSLGGQLHGELQGRPAQHHVDGRGHQQIDDVGRLSKAPVPQHAIQHPGDEVGVSVKEPQVRVGKEKDIHRSILEDHRPSL